MIAMSLLVKSPLFLFPLLLVCYEAVDAEHRPSKDWRAGALFLLIAPLLILAPWIWMNWSLYHRVIPFENGRADTNIITGALGFVQTAEGDFRGYVGLGPPDSAIIWAAKTVLRHPFHFAASYVERLWFVSIQHPAILVMAALALWWSRRERDFRAVGLLTVYFVGICCLMPLEARYLEPAWPVAAVLAACAFARFVDRRKPDGRSMAGVWVVLAPLAAFSIFVLCLVCAYPSRVSAGPSAIERELISFPDDAWLWQQHGLYRLGAGNSKEAVRDMRRSLALLPRSAARMDYALALLVESDSNWRFVEQLHLENNPSTSRSFYLLRTVHLLEAGDWKTANAAYNAARESWRHDNDRVRGPSDAASASVLSAGDDRFCTVALRSILSPFDSARILSLLKSSATDTDREFRSCLVRAAEGAEHRRPYGDPVGEAGEPILYQEALRAFQSGQQDKAFALLSQTIKANPHYVEAYLSRGALLSERGDWTEALDDYDRGLRYLPSQMGVRADLLTSRAYVLEKLGCAKEARDDLNEVLEITPPRSPQSMAARSSLLSAARGEQRPAAGCPLRE